MVTSAPERRVGTSLRGKYRLERLLGVGGMAAVYAGVHRNGLEVAVKVLHPWAAADETIVKRFVREGYIANSIEHPGAVRVLDDDVAEDGSVFLVMDLLRGRPLADLGEHGPGFPLDAALDVADQLLDVLAVAHARSIVHRDLKPDNVFITHSGQLKVLDLGIARMRGLTGTTAATRGGVMMGTPGYMPPEQVLGEQEKIDGRTDVWAVGATLFTLFTGRLVHECATPEQTMLRAATTPVEPLASVAGHVPAPIAGVIDRALAMSQDDRWQDARAMQSALRAAREAARLPSFIAGAPLAKVLHGSALSRTVAGPPPATTTSKMATATAISEATLPSRRRSVVALMLSGLALAALATFAVQTQLAKTRAAPPVTAASTAAFTAAPPALPTPETPPAATTASTATTDATETTESTETNAAAGVVVAAPASSHAPPTLRRRSSPRRPPPSASSTAPAPAAPAPPTSDPFDRP